MGKRAEQKEPSYLERLFEARQLVDKGIAPTDPDAQAKYPILWSLLTDPHIGEDKVTEPAYLRIQNSSGDWSFSVMSPGVGGGCEVMVRTIQEGLPALEEKLRQGPEAWRFWRGSKVIVRPNGKGEKKD